MYIDMHVHVHVCTGHVLYIHVHVCDCEELRPVIPTLPITPAQLMRPGIG